MLTEIIGIKVGKYTPFPGTNSVVFNLTVYVCFKVGLNKYPVIISLIVAVCNYLLLLS